VSVNVFECDVAAGVGTDVVQIWGGEATGAEFDGPMLAIKCSGANALFDRRLPRLLLQRSCNHALFDSGCALDRADWTLTAKVYTYAGTTLVLDTFARTGGLPDGFGFAHWLAMGYVERTVTGIIHRSLIFDSAAIDGSSRISLTLGSTASPAFVAGDDVQVFPGCDNQLATCKAWHAVNNPAGKFNNSENFGGFPLMPDTNPSFQPLKKSTSSSGKK
jgi:uncharacterized phage protein (TIGR02218 family)